MERFKIIKNYRAKVHKIIKDQKLTPYQDIDKLIDPTHHTVGIFCSNFKNDKVLLRILITSDKKKNNSFIKEFMIYNFFKRHRNLFNKLPLLIKGSIDKQPKWMIRKFYPGQMTGDFWGFDKEKLTPSLTKLLIEYILKLQSKSNEWSKKNKLPKRAANWFIKDWKNDLDYNPDFVYSVFINKYLNLRERKKLDLIFKNYKDLLNKNCHFFTHGDLMPQNILIDQNKKIFFIDWEEAHLNNPLFDTSYIYVNAWQDKSWREKFLKKFIKLHPERDKKILSKLAQLNILVISLRMAEYAHLNLVHQKILIKRALREHLKTIKSILKNI